MLTEKELDELILSRTRPNFSAELESAEKSNVPKEFDVAFRKLVSRLVSEGEASSVGDLYLGKPSHAWIAIAKQLLELETKSVEVARIACIYALRISLAKSLSILEKEVDDKIEEKRAVAIQATNRAKEQISQLADKFEDFGEFVQALEQDPEYAHHREVLESAIEDIGSFASFLANQDFEMGQKRAHCLWLYTYFDRLINRGVPPESFLAKLFHYLSVKLFGIPSLESCLAYTEWVENYFDNSSKRARILLRAM